MFQNEKKVRKNGSTEMADFDFRPLTEESLAEPSLPEACVKSSSECQGVTKKVKTKSQQRKIMFYICVAL